jgi:hypothetical protein
MPIYEYRRHDCRSMFQALMRGDHTVTCPTAAGFQAPRRPLDHRSSGRFGRRPSRLSYRCLLKGHTRSAQPRPLDSFRPVLVT